MSPRSPGQDRTALNALLISLVPFFSTLSMLALKLGFGPRNLLYPIAQVSGFLVFGLIVIGSALCMVAWSNLGGRRDWRIPAAFTLQILSVGMFLLFVQKG